VGEELSFMKDSWDGYFLSQETASLRYSWRLPLRGVAPSQSIQFQGTWEKSLVPGFRFTAHTGLLFDPDAPILAESPPYAAQVAILPGDFSARSYAGFSAGLEKSIFKFFIGTVSLSASYQVVYSHGSILKNSFDHGCVGMFTVYLSRFAMPALGAGVAYNVSKNYLQGSFAIGMSF
ncbi:MAG: hypothetical protein FWF29_04775, partial [Treponema sp.]|nr:hypothetical protein [Treponema sp.]